MRHWFFILVLFIPTGCTTTSGAYPIMGKAQKEPTLTQALEVPAWALAQSYLWVKSFRIFLSVAESRATIQIPGDTITKHNVANYRRSFEKRLSIYEAAIKQRGYKTINGTYTGKTTVSCSKINSLWVGILHEKPQSEVEILQTGMDAQIVIKVEHEGKKLSLQNQAAIAESAVSIVDTMNSDYYFLGDIQDHLIVIKPNLSVLDNWPKWANPPSLKDLENCTITLTPLSGGLMK